MNTEDSLEKLENQFLLASSLADINRQTQEAKESDILEEKGKLIETAPEAKQKLVEKAGDLKKLKKNDLRAILYVDYDVWLCQTTKKDTIIEKLNEKRGVEI